ncbi:hypothetical protein ACLKMH_18905 [Psychromonas sp. KJ10-10]|uniref:hypothetical protein n=1 Tax=Psychromonas sp. KJ10-10 TaxID=3391823 RepID=UPI0039B6DF29
MNQDLDNFLKQNLRNESYLSENAILQQGFELLKVQLSDYLQSQGLTAYTFTQAIKVGRKSNNPETNGRFWSALEAFYLAVGDAIDHKTKHKRWLRFVNIIENLQGYSGSLLIEDKHIRSKRIKRLYLAYILTWEHLRYIAGNEDDYNPSELVLTTFTGEDVHFH